MSGVEDMIKKVEVFRCKRCGFITDYKATIKGIRESGLCPACGDGKGKAWVGEYESKPFRGG